MTLRGTDPESYITEYTIVHEDKCATFMWRCWWVPHRPGGTRIRYPGGNRGKKK